MFALIAAVIAILAAFGVGHFQLMLWLFLAALALHFAFGWLGINQPWASRQP